MNAVVYYSNTGQSKRVAEFFAKATAFELYDIFEPTECVFESAILVFPVHCQSVPAPVKDFLKRLTVKHLTVIATYGRMCYGNALYYVQKHYRHNIVAAAYVPTKHSYCEGRAFDGWQGLDPIVDKLKSPAPVKIPKTYKNPLSDFFKGWRSRTGVKIYKDGRCDNCGRCTAVCDNGAIKNGKTNGRCIRCLKCVENCPTKALRFALRLPMRLYLKKRQIDDLIVYV